MAIYKPSNFYPNLEEIDVTEDNIFTCQVNTSGTTVKAYKIKILSSDNIELYLPSAVQLSSSNYVENQGILQMPMLSSSYTNITNGNNYKWSVRVYEAVLNSTAQPQTLVCTGYLTGSTASVMWSTDFSAIQQNRWVQVNTTITSGVPNNMLAILPPNNDNLVYPADGEYTERHQISWVTEKLGFNKNMTKIEFDEPFIYNYVNGTSYYIYQVSDKHTLNSVFIDPSDSVNIGVTYIELFNSGTSVDNTKRKIIGYDSDTGEVRVQVPFNAVPTNNLTFTLYTLDGSTYTALTITTSNQVGGGICGSSQIISNEYLTNNRLFIQPNINIKSDDTNPCEIVFSNGARLNINKTTSTTLVPGKTVDTTIDKLDNTQWLLKSAALQSGTMPALIPGTTYSIYTDFMDSLPENIFYGRVTPVISLYYKDYNGTADYSLINSTAVQPFRDISFKAQWTGTTNIKNYYYILFDSNKQVIKQSDIIYSSTLTWNFRGLKTGTVLIGDNISPQTYYIQIVIEDEFSKIFESNVQQFLIGYKTQANNISIIVTNDCTLCATRVQLLLSVLAETTNISSDITTVTETDITSDTNGVNYLTIPANQALNYLQTVPTTTVTSELLNFGSSYSCLINFQITSQFLKDINQNNTAGMLFSLYNTNIFGSVNTYNFYVNNFNYLIPTYDSTGAVTYAYNTKLGYIQCNGPTGNEISIFGTNNYYSIVANDPEGSSYYYVPTSVKYALQDNSSNTYVIVNSLPASGKLNTKYVLTTQYQNGASVFYKGIYTYNTTSLSWQYDASAQFVFVGNTSAVPGSTYDSLNVPTNCRVDTTGTSGALNYWDANNVWIENFDFTDLNGSCLDNTWFTLIFSVEAPANQAIIAYSASAPADAETGDIYYNTSNSTLYIYNAQGDWISEGSPISNIYYYIVSTQKIYEWSGTAMQEVTVSWNSLLTVKASISSSRTKEVKS